MIDGKVLLHRCPQGGVEVEMGATRKDQPLCRAKDNLRRKVQELPVKQSTKAPWTKKEQDELERLLSDGKPPLKDKAAWNIITNALGTGKNAKACDDKCAQGSTVPTLIRSLSAHACCSGRGP